MMKFLAFEGSETWETTPSTITISSTFPLRPLSEPLVVQPDLKHTRKSFMESPLGTLLARVHFSLNFSTGLTKKGLQKFNQFCLLLEIQVLLWKDEEKKKEVQKGQLSTLWPFAKSLEDEAAVQKNLSSHQTVTAQ